MDFNQEEDALLLENIDEFVNDENKIVTYKWMSMTLQLDVNRSKRLLEKFSEMHNDLNVIYFVGGWKKTDTSTKTLSYVLVKKENLLRAKERFSNLTCCDIYSVQKCVIQDSSMLYSADSELVTNGLDSLHKYNTIQCKDKNAKRPQKYIANGCSLSESDINHSKKVDLSAALSGNLTVSKTVPVEKKCIKKEDTKESPPLSFFGNKQMIAKKHGSNIGNVSTAKSCGKSIEISKTEKVINKPNEMPSVKVEEKSNPINEKMKNMKEEKSNKEIEETFNKKTGEVSNMKTEEKSNKSEEKSNQKMQEKPNQKIEEKPNQKNEENKKKTDENLLKSSSKREEKNLKKNQSLTLKPQENSTLCIDNQTAEERQMEEKNQHKSRKTEGTVSSPKKKKISPKKRKLVHQESDSDNDFEDFIEKNKNSSKNLSLTKSSKKNIKPTTNEDDDIDVDVVAPTPDPPEKLKMKRRKRSKKDSEAEKDNSTQEHLSFNLKENITNTNSTTGKRRGHRMVLKSKQYVNDDGFMVTKKEFENESFSEDSESEIQQKKITDEKLIDASEKTSNDSMKTEKISTVSKHKSKHQASLMSFFKKN